MNPTVNFLPTKIVGWISAAHPPQINVGWISKAHPPQGNVGWISAAHPPCQRKKVDALRLSTLQLRLRLRHLCCAILLMAFATAACANDDASPPDAYLEAMRLIADGRKQEAGEVLARIIRDEPEHAGAWLDLAILQCEMGHAAEAERLFAKIVARFDPPPAILEIIAQRHALGCAVTQPAGRASLMVGRGFDNNVNQGASAPYFALGSGASRIELQLLPEYLPMRDQFTVLSAEYAHSLDVRGMTGFVQLQARGNDVLTRYDTALLAAGAEHPWRAGGWRMRGAATMSALSLGGALYQKQGRLQALAAPPLPLPENLSFDLSAVLTHTAYPALANFDARSWEMGALLNYAAQRGQVQAMAGYASDRAMDARPGGDRNGWSASFQYSARLPGNLFGELAWSRQTWRGETAYSPGLIDQARHQTTDLLRAGLVIPMAAQQAIRIDLRQVSNNENISIFQYRNRQLLVSWLWRSS